MISYGFTRTFKNMNVPPPIQSVYIKDYCNKLGFTFSLPANELCINNSYYILRSLIRDATPNSHICSISFFCLPVDDFNLMNHIIEDIYSNNLTFHFILEKLILNPKELLNFYSNYFHYKL